LDLKDPENGSFGLIYTYSANSGYKMRNNINLSNATTTRVIGSPA
jgi:hypothetical protein